MNVVHEADAACLNVTRSVNLPLQIHVPGNGHCRARTTADGKAALPGNEAHYIQHTSNVRFRRVKRDARRRIDRRRCAIDRHGVRHRDGAVLAVENNLRPLNRHRELVLMTVVTDARVVIEDNRASILGRLRRRYFARVN